VNAIRAVLISLLVSIVGYTAVVVANYGFGLLPIFFGEWRRWAGLPSSSWASGEW
jgi:hypothetical protein